MMINASALNSVALNAPTRQTVFAFAVMVASSVVGAEALVTRFSQAAVFGDSSIGSVPTHVHAAHGVVDANCVVVAINPRQTFSSASIVLTGGGLLAAPDITRYCGASVACEASISVEPWLLRGVSADAYANAAMYASAVGVTFGVAGLQCSCTVSGEAKRTTFSGCEIGPYANVSAIGTITQAASAVLPVTATLTAAAGFANPSASLVLSGAQLYADAYTTQRAAASPIVGESSMSVSGDVTRFSASSLLCAASGTATARFLWYGQALGSSGATLGASPIQRHSAATTFSATATLSASGIAARMSVCAIEPLAIVQAAGVVRRMGSGVIQTSATVQASPQVVRPASCNVICTSDIGASGVKVRMGAASAQCAAQASALADQFHAATLIASGVASSTANATRVVMGGAQVSTGSSVTSASTVRIGGAAVVDAGAGVELIAYLLGNALARDPEERTMRRVGVDRVMRRPFVDRTMKAVRA